jgi:arylsulfatase A-like enzyme
MKNLTCLILLAVLPPLSVWAKPTKPNALFIAFDDLNDWVGFPDDHPQVVTPHMDTPAKRGCDFNTHCVMEKPPTTAVTAFPDLFTGRPENYKAAYF